MTDAISLVTSTSNQTWPFVTIPNFEVLARNCRQQSGLELLVLFHRVSEAQREVWIEYATTRYQAMVEEAHIAYSGSLARLTPVGYNPFITKASPTGFVRSDIHDEYFVAWHTSPPHTTYGYLNFNGNSLRHNGRSKLPRVVFSASHSLVATCKSHRLLQRIFTSFCF